MMLSFLHPSHKRNEMKNENEKAKINKKKSRRISLPKAEKVIVLYGIHICYAYGNAYDYYHIGNWIVLYIHAYLLMYVLSHIGKNVQMYAALDAVSILFTSPPPHFSFVSDLELRSVVDVCSFDIQIVSFLAKEKISGIDGIKMTETKQVGMDRIKSKRHIEFASTFNATLVRKRKRLMAIFVTYAT